MFKIAVGAFVVVLIAAAGLYWDRGRLVENLAETEARLQSAQLDAALQSETIDVLRIHSRQLDVLRETLRDAETEIRNSEGFDDATPDIILNAICSRGMC